MIFLKREKVKKSSVEDWKEYLMFTLIFFAKKPSRVVTVNHSGHCLVQNLDNIEPAVKQSDWLSYVFSPLQ